MLLLYQIPHCQSASCFRDVCLALSPVRAALYSTVLCTACRPVRISPRCSEGEENNGEAEWRTANVHIDRHGYVY